MAADDGHPGHAGGNAVGSKATAKANAAADAPSPPRLMIRRFDARGASLKDQMAIFDQFAGDRYVVPKQLYSSEKIFPVGFSDVEFGPFSVALAESRGEFHFKRSRAEIRRNMIDDITVVYRISGSGKFSTAELENNFLPGSCIFSDMSQEFVYSESISGGDHIRFRLPRDFADKAVRGVDRLHNSVRNDIFSRVLGDHLRSIANNSTILNAENVKAVSEITSSIVSVLFSPTRDNILMAREPIDAGLRARAIQFIDRNLLSKGLAPDSVASAIGVSRRTLYRIFEPSGGVAKTILERRLDNAHAVLMDPGAFRRIKEVAYSHGFESDAHFARCFKRRFGYRPSETAEQAFWARL